MEERSFITVKKPPLDVFATNSAESQANEDKGESIPGALYDRTDYPEDGDMLTYYFDHAFPMKGEPYPDAVDAILSAKKLFIKTAKFMTKHYVLSATLFLLPNVITRRLWKSLIQQYVIEFAYDMTLPHALVDKRYCRSVRELRRAGLKVVDEKYSADKNILVPFLETFASIMQWDNAHRYRFQDVAGELDKNAFEKNPSKEINRLVHIQVSRERGWHETKGRYVIAGAAMRFLMFFNPYVKRLLKDLVRETNLDEVKLDEGDDYHNLMRPDYDVHGWPMELRQNKFLKIRDEYYKNNPTRMQSGQDKYEQWTSFENLKRAVLKENGIPFILFAAIRHGNQSLVKMIETTLSLNNPSLKVAAKNIFDGQGSPKKPEEKNEVGAEPKV